MAVKPELERGRYVRVGTRPLCQRKVSLRVADRKCIEAGSGFPGNCVIMESSSFFGSGDTLTCIH